MTIMLAIILCFADPNDITPTTVSINIVPSRNEQVYAESVEIKWLSEPNGLQSLMDEWYSPDPNIAGWHAEYAQVITDNWLRPTRPVLLTVDDQAEMRLPYSWFGDLNHDGCIRMDDFGIAAKYYKGRIKNPPEPEPMTEIESLAEIMKLFLQ